MSLPSDADRRTLTDSLVDLYINLDRTYAAASRDVRLTPQQAQLLCVAEHEHPTLGRLAEALGCDKTNITGLVDRAVKRGLVERCDDAQDRRVTRVEMTVEGRRLIARFHQSLQRRLSGIRLGQGLIAADIDAISDQLGTAGDPPSGSPPR